MSKFKFDGLEGISFGITSGVITVLGVLIGLAATGNKIFTELGIIVVGIADAFSDAAGMYVSEESEYIHTKKQIRRSTLFTFLGKIFTLIILAFPLFVFELYTAVAISLILAFIIIGSLGYFVAKGSTKLSIRSLILKYILIVTVVALISYLVGYSASIFIK